MRIKILFIILFFTACCADSKEKENNPIKLIGENIKQVSLSSVLNEISGLDVDSLGRLFAHDDEKGVIYELNINDGSIIKKFQLGTYGIEADFEGLAIADKRFFIIESSGILYEFEEGNNNSSVGVKKYDLNFSSKFEIEGLCFDKKLNGLLIACKNYSGKKYKDERPIFLFSLESNKIIPDPFFAIDLAVLKKDYDLKDFYPSGITKSPISNNYYVVSAKGDPALVILSEAGKILSAERLEKEKHKQPEGITFLRDGTMVICDEKVNKHATLTFYMNKSGNKNGL